MGIGVYVRIWYYQPVISLTPIQIILGARAKITEYEANLDVISKQQSGGI